MHDNVPYSLCLHCDHFVEPNDTLDGDCGEKVGEDERAVYFRDDKSPAGKFGVAKFIHLEDGNQEFDHDANPGQTHTLAGWKKLRPDLFTEHPDGAIGPNSRFHNQRGKEG